MFYKIPPPSTLNSVMTVTLPLGGQAKRFRLHFRYHPYLNQWRLSIGSPGVASSGGANPGGATDVDDIPLVSCTNSNLLAPFAHKGLGEMYIVPTQDAPVTQDPGKEGLQNGFEIYWGES